MERINDVLPAATENMLAIYVDGKPVNAVEGETVLSTLFAMGRQAISRNDHGHVVGAYCGMGICHCCALNIDGVEKQRACQTVVKHGMKVITQSNRLDAGKVGT